MDTINAMRFRLILLLIFALTLWNTVNSHPVRHPFAWGLIASIAAWLVGVAMLRRRPWRGPTALLLYLSGFVATAYNGSLGMLLVVAIGCVGAWLPWRLLRWLAAPVVALPVALAVVDTHEGLTWALLSNASFDSYVVTVCLVLAVGRLLADNSEARKQQAQALGDLRTAHARLQQQTLNAEELAALRERSRLARELHDTLGHALSAITVQAEAARRVLSRDPEQVEGMLREVQGIARQAMSDLRGHLRTLREPDDAVDLDQRLRGLAQDGAARNGWQLALDIAHVPLGPEGQRCLLQVAREALTNSERHAAARSVAVRLAAQDGDVVLSISDDGQGFAREPADGHFGLRGMRERLAELGGRMTVESARARGTRIVARLPAEALGQEGA